MATFRRDVSFGLMACILGLLSSFPADAAPITWTITGPVDFTFGSWVNVLPLGSPATLTVTFEQSAANSPACQSAGQGLYPASLSGNVSVLNFNVPFGGGAIEVNAPGGNCGGSSQTGVEFHMFHSGAQPVDSPGGFPFEEILALVQPTNTNGVNLNSILGGATSSSVNVQSMATNTGFRFNGAIQAVPEPGTLMLLATGLAMAVRSRRTIAARLKSR